LLSLTELPPPELDHCRLPPDTADLLPAQRLKLCSWDKWAGAHAAAVDLATATASAPAASAAVVDHCSHYWR